jgi:uncharacterized membrane protein YfcA
MDVQSWFLIAILMAIAAALYSSVGHGGASAYLAIMALFSVDPEVMRPTALSLNLLVSTLAVIRFARFDQVNWRLLATFGVTAVPAAFIGGLLVLPPAFYRPLVGLVLLAAAARLLWRPTSSAERPITPPSLRIALPTGAGLGLLAGLTGTGGGIFLSPLIILLGWEETRRTSGVAAAFILLNSAAGLLGNQTGLRALPPELLMLAIAVLIGGIVGTRAGTSRLPKRHLLQLLGLVLVIAGLKLVLQ